MGTAQKLYWANRKASSPQPNRKESHETPDHHTGYSLARDHRALDGR